MGMYMRGEAQEDIKNSISHCSALFSEAGFPTQIRCCWPACCRSLFLPSETGVTTGIIRLA